VRGSVYQRCSCRDQETRKPLGRKCPKLRNKRHATGWFFRYDAPRGPDGKRRRPEAGPFATKQAAEEELAATLARLGGGAQVPDRSLLTGAYLDVSIVKWFGPTRRRELWPRVCGLPVQLPGLAFRVAVLLVRSR
jgi:Arm DNA-binding domain